LIIRGWLAKFRQDNFSDKLSEAKRQLAQPSRSELRTRRNQSWISFLSFLRGGSHSDHYGVLSRAIIERPSWLRYSIVKYDPNHFWISKSRKCVDIQPLVAGIWRIS
jgi:hypothetical protein